MKIRFLVLNLLLLLNACQNQKSEQIIAKIGNQSIYISQVDSAVTQLLYDELEKIYMIRKKALEFQIERSLLEFESKKRNMNMVDFLDSVYKNISSEKKDAFYAHSKVDSFFPILRNGKYIQLKVNSIEGQHYLSDNFKYKIKKQLVDSLKKVYSVIYLLEAPMKQVINLAGTKRIIKGNLNAKNTFIIISDYECLSCRNQYPFLKKLYNLFNHKLRFEYIYFSDRVHLSAMAGEAAKNQNKFEAMSDLLYVTEYSPEDTASFYKMAKLINLNMSTFGLDIRNQKTFGDLNNSIITLNNNGIRNTPTFIFNSKLISNFADEESIISLINAEIEIDNNK